MSFRRLASTTLPLVLALAACKDVEQSAPPEVLLFATFDKATGTIPQPNDLTLQAAPSLPDSPLKAALLAFAASGGYPAAFPANPALTYVNVTLRQMQRVPGFVYDPAHESCQGTPPTYVPQSAYAPADVEDLDPATVNASTVAIVRMDGTPTVLEPQFVVFTKQAGPPVAPFAGKQLGVLTIGLKDVGGGTAWPTGASGARYVVALRGGPAGIKTTAGHALAADAAIQFIAANQPLSNPEYLPLGTFPDLNCNGTNADEIGALEQLRALYANPLTWCYVSGAGWVPPAVAGLPPAACTAPQPPPQPVETAYAAIDRVFPHSELASIQAFGIAPAP